MQDSKSLDVSQEASSVENKIKNIDTSAVMQQDITAVVKKDTLTSAPKTKMLSNKKTEQKDVERSAQGISGYSTYEKPIYGEYEISQMTLTKSPDTLVSIVSQLYNSCEYAFPKSIACDFEHGISTESISYQTMFFYFSIFENSKALKPYLIKRFTVLKDHDGKIIVE